MVGVGQHDLTHLLVGALARAQDVVNAALLELDHGLVADHAAIGDDAHPGDAEALAQAVDHREQRLHVGGVAGPRLRADWPALAVEHDADDHLAQVGTVVLGLAVAAERLAAGAVEVERGGVEQYDGLDR